VLSPFSVAAIRILGAGAAFCLAAVAARAQLAPVIFSQPMSLAIAPGNTLVLNVDATGTPPLRFQWRRDGSAIAGATQSRFVLASPVAASAGRYDCVVSNAVGFDTSRAAVVEVVAETGDGVGRLINLSVLTPTGPGSRLLTLGAVIGPATRSGPMPVVVRAVGPTLGQPPFNLPGVLADPELVLFQGERVLAANDDWGGDAGLGRAFASVGAFALPPASRDSAVWLASPGAEPGNYTVQVAGKAGGSGLVIAELYDAAGAGRTATTARLINLSTLHVVEGESALAAGFVLGGRTARTVLIRAVGPSLAAAPFGLTGMLADPVLELFARSGLRLGGNNDWGGEAALRSVMAAVGAFPLATAESKDAVLLVTLPPGDYTAQVVGTGDGRALLEVYEVP
jgi:hypothetical protein